MRQQLWTAQMVSSSSGILHCLTLKNILFFCSVTLTVDMWKLFNESYILPGPGTSNTSLFQYMYESGFNVFNMGYASAIGVVLILILIVISVIQFIVRHKQGEI